MAEIHRPKMRAEQSVSFKKQTGAWKLDSMLMLADPDKIKRPKDFVWDKSNADMDRDGNIGGRIVRTEFNPDHTLVVLRVMDEEIAVFLPVKKVLEDSGEPMDDFAPWKLHEFSGHPHKTDSLKFFATSGKGLAEEE